jgi:hypothetical protein
MDSSRIPFSTRAKNLTGALNLNSLSVTNGITGTTITASGEMNANSLSVTNGIAAKDITTTGLIQGDNLHASAGITGTTITATDITASDLLIINGMIDLNGSIDLNGTTGNSGDVLTSNGTSDPTWSALAPAQPTITSVGTLTSLTSSGNITGGSNSILSVASNNDTLHTLGKAKIGHMITSGDYAGFSHFDHANSASYALLQGPNGDVYSSSGFGQTHQFKTALNTGGNANWMTGSTAGVTITPDLTVSSGWSGQIKFVSVAPYDNYSRIYSTQSGDIWTMEFFVRAMAVLTVKNQYGSPSILFNGNVIHSSDDRLKHNEKDINNGLDLIRQLNPQFYQKTNELKDANFIGDLSDGTWRFESGFIAQEVLAIPDLSYCVDGGDYIDDSGNLIESPYYLNYTNIFTYGIASIKELDAIVTTQASTISTLEAKLATQEAKLSALEARLVSAGI